MLIGIASNVLYCKPDISKKNGYFINLKANNFEKKLYHVVDLIALNNLSCLSSCLYMDIDNTQNHPTTKFISSVPNYKDLKTPIDPTSEILVIIYLNRDYFKLLND